MHVHLSCLFLLSNIELGANELKSIIVYIQVEASPIQRPAVEQWIDFLDSGRDIMDMVPSQHLALVTPPTADLSVDLWSSLLRLVWPFAEQ